MIGRTLSHYQILEKIGEGGMGEVYKGHDERLDRNVAIKVLPTGTLANDHARQRFRKEALALSKLNHPNIATVHDFDTQQGTDFIVMELVEGTSLAEKVETGPLPEKEISNLGSQIADALEEAHEIGIVHRDLKPGNIVVTSKGRVKVLDFGLAKMLRPVSDEATTEALTQEHAVAGTLPYMSPEELRGEKADHRSDLFSFGVVLYQIATGRRPFEHTISTALADAIIHKSPEPPSTHNRKVSPGLESIIIKALDKDPDHRYQSAREMRVDLERLSAPISGVIPRRKRRRTHRWLWAAAFVVAVIAILFALNVGGLRDRLLGEPSPGPIESIAVLPFDNLMTDPEQEYFVEGMHEALITNLSKIGALRITSRTSAMRYKGTDRTIPEIAHELGVDALVEGSVLRANGRVRITAQLIHGATDEHLWAESYDRDLENVLVLLSDVARAIAGEIEVALTPEQQERLTSSRAVSPEIQEMYLKANYFTNRLTKDGIRKALVLYRQTIDLDPTFAPAHSGLAGAEFFLGFLGMAPLDATMPRAEAAALRALELDPELAQAHSVLGLVRLYYHWDWTGADSEFRRALALNPNDALARHGLADHLLVMGDVDGSVHEVELGRQCDPLSPITVGPVMFHLVFAHRYEEAIAEADKALELFPERREVHWLRAKALWYQGSYEEALAEFRKAESGESLLHDVMERAYLEHGPRAAMRAAADALAAQSQSSRVNPLTISSYYAAAEETDLALEWLEKALEARIPQLLHLKGNPDFDPLLDDPRFQDLLRRMNFPE